MNRCDLDEIIVDLEYLQTHALEAEAREEYAQQLHAFRALLQSGQQAVAAKARDNDARDWDAALALLYAEEELFLAAQALIARDVPEAHKHLRRLREHEHSLPEDTGTCLRSLEATYTRLENAREPDELATHTLATTTIALLDAVRRKWRNHSARANSPDTSADLTAARKRKG